MAFIWLAFLLWLHCPVLFCWLCLVVCVSFLDEMKKKKKNPLLSEMRKGWSNIDEGSDRAIWTSNYMLNGKDWRLRGCFQEINLHYEFKLTIMGHEKNSMHQVSLQCELVGLTMLRNKNASLYFVYTLHMEGSSAPLYKEWKCVRLVVMRSDWPPKVMSETNFSLLYMMAGPFSPAICTLQFIRINAIVTVGPRKIQGGPTFGDGLDAHPSKRKSP